MPKLATPLTDLQVKTAKPKDKPYTLADGGGMYLEVMPTGSKIWRMAYRQPNGKNTRLTFGAYPEVSLVDARRKRMDARKLRAEGIDPAETERAKKINKATAAANTFEKLAREWHGNRLSTWRESTARDTLRRLEIDIFPEIGTMPIAAVTHQHMIAALRKIENRGAHEIAHRVKATCARVFSYANQQGIENRNPAADLRACLRSFCHSSQKCVNWMHEKSIPKRRESRTI
jgi:hypothetical protein